MDSPTAEHMAEEIDRRVDFITSQVQLGCPQPDVQDEQARQLLVGYSTIVGLSMDVATAVTQKLAGGTWTPEQKRQFGVCLRAAQSRATTKKQTRATQQMPRPEYWFTSDDHAQWATDDPIDMKVQSCAARMTLWGSRAQMQIY